MANGWAAAIDEFKETRDRTGRGSTVGDLIREVQRTSSLRLQTLSDYSSRFRRIVGDICGIEKTRKRFDPYKGGREKWLEKVDAVPLEKITPKKVQQWKLKYLANRADDPLEEKKARTTLNSIIRCAKALFSKKALRFVEIDLPEPLPFEGIDFEQVRTTRYKSQIDP